MKLTLRPVTPTGTTRSVSFVTNGDDNDGCTCHVKVDDHHPVYPKSERGERMRRERLAAGLSMGDAARLFGIRVSDVSGLEHGELDTDEWAFVFAAIAEAGR